MTRVHRDDRNESVRSSAPDRPQTLTIVEIS